MIKNITIKNVATFNESGICLDNLKRINFIYGCNGSGKTTIANYLNGMSPKLYEECSHEWVAGDEHEKILVYNTKFRESTIANAEGIPGVFTLGSASTEVRKKIEELKVNRNDIQKKINDRTNKKNELLQTETEQNNELNEKLWSDIYKKYERFGEALIGMKKKANFADKMKKEYADNLSQSQVSVSFPTDEDMWDKYRVIFSKTDLKVREKIHINNYVDQLYEIISNQIWETKIIGKQDVAIGDLINKLSNHDWVLQGKQYLKDDSNICPFCQQPTITGEFRKQLEEYFDETFNENLQKIKDLKDKYNECYDKMIRDYEAIIQIEKGSDRSFLDISAVEARINHIKTTSKLLMSKMSEKIKEPNRSITMESYSEDIEEINALIAVANTKIEEYDSMIQNKNDEQTKFKDLLYKKMANSASVTLEAYKKKCKGLSKGIANLDDQIAKHNEECKGIDEELGKLEDTITSIQPTVKSINSMLKLYGFTSFSIVESEKAAGYYQMQRENGTLATKTLSEGELTFISFLYFMQVAKGATDKKEIVGNRILVIDDPISSLDSSSLFVVSSLLKELFKEMRKDESYKRCLVKQVVLLTHNVYFHKDVTFVDGGQSRYKDMKFWVLRKNKQISEVQCFDDKNPIHSAYELLWKELKVSKRNNDYISTPNIMRRILETYFKVFGGWTDNDIITKFDEPEEREMVRTLMVWSNQGSHDVFDDLEVEAQESSISKYHDVFKLIFEKLNHIEHYNMMMSSKEENNP